MSEFRRGVEKLTSIFGRRKAEESIRECLRRNPEEFVREALDIMLELKSRYDRKRFEALKKILVEEAFQNPRILGILSVEALECEKHSKLALETVEEIGKPLAKLKNLLSRANDLVSKCEKQGIGATEAREGVSRALTLVGEGRIEEAVNVVEELIHRLEEIQSITRLAEELGVSEEDVKNYLKIIEERYPKQVLEKTRDVLVNAASSRRALDVLKKEIAMGKPPYMTYAKLWYKDEVELVKKALTTTPTNAFVEYVKRKFNLDPEKSSDDFMILKLIDGFAEVYGRSLPPVLEKDMAFGGWMPNSNEFWTENHNIYNLKGEKVGVISGNLIGATLSPEGDKCYTSTSVPKSFLKALVSMTLSTAAMVATGGQVTPAVDEGVHEPLTTVYLVVRENGRVKAKRVWIDTVDCLGWLDNDTLLVYVYEGEKNEGHTCRFIALSFRNGRAEKLWEKTVALDPDLVAPEGVEGKLFYKSVVNRENKIIVTVAERSGSREKERLATLIAFSFDGEKLWRVDTESRSTYSLRLEWSPSGEYMLVYDKPEATLLDTKGRVVWRRSGCESARWHPRRDELYITYKLDEVPRLMIYSPSKGVVKDIPSCELGLAEFFPDGSKLVVTIDPIAPSIISANGRLLWEEYTGDPMPRPSKLRLSPDGSKLAVSFHNSSAKTYCVSVRYLRQFANEILKAIEDCDRKKLLKLARNYLEGLLKDKISYSPAISYIIDLSMVNLVGKAMEYWDNGACSITSEELLKVRKYSPILGDVVSYLCRGNYIDAVVAYVFAVESGLVGNDLWFAYYLVSSGIQALTGSHMEVLGAAATYLALACKYAGVKGFQELRDNLSDPKVKSAALTLFNNICYEVAKKLLETRDPVEASEKARELVAKTYSVAWRLKRLIEITTESSRQEELRELPSIFRKHYRGGGVEELLDALQTTYSPVKL